MVHYEIVMLDRNTGIQEPIKLDPIVLHYGHNCFIEAHLHDNKNAAFSCKLADFTNLIFFL